MHPGGGSGARSDAPPVIHTITTAGGDGVDELCAGVRSMDSGGVDEGSALVCSMDGGGVDDICDGVRSMDGGGVDDICDGMQAVNRGPVPNAVDDAVPQPPTHGGPCVDLEAKEAGGEEEEEEEAEEEKAEEAKEAEAEEAKVVKAKAEKVKQAGAKANERHPDRTDAGVLWRHGDPSDFEELMGTRSPSPLT